MTNKEANEILKELEIVRPEKLTGDAKRLFEAIMTICDERDELIIEVGRQIAKNDILKEKISEYKKQLDLDYVDKNYISKDKIKAKIERCQELFKEETNPNTLITLRIVENEMQSLLEKE